MAPVVVDLTSSPEPEESSAGAAKLALEEFAPRSQKVIPSKPRRKEPHLEPPPVKRASNGSNRTLFGDERLHAIEAIAEPTGQLVMSNSQSVNLNQPERTPQASNFPRHISADSHAHPKIGSKSHSSLPNVARSTIAFVHSASGSGITSTGRPKQLDQSTPRPPEARVEVIIIDDDSDTASSRSGSGAQVNAVLEEELNEPRPFKRRRVDDCVPGSGDKGTGKPKANFDNATTRLPSDGELGMAQLVSAPLTVGLTVRQTPPTFISKSIERTPSVQGADPYPSSRGIGSSASTSVTKAAISGAVRAGNSSSAGGPQYKESIDLEQRFSSSLSEVFDREAQKSGFEPENFDARTFRIVLNENGHESTQSFPLTSPPPHASEQSVGSIPDHYSEANGPSDKRMLSKDSQPGAGRSVQKERMSLFSQIEDDLLIKLRDVDSLEWNDILEHFPDRTMGSISGYYGQLKARQPKRSPEVSTAVQRGFRVGNHGVPYSAEEDALLKKLKEQDQLSWEEIVPHFSGRTRGSLQVRYSSKVKSSWRSTDSTRTPKPAIAYGSSSTNHTNHRVHYSAEEDAKIVKLKGEGLNWDQMVAHFNGRTAGSLAVRFSTKLEDRADKHFALKHGDVPNAANDEDSATRPLRRRRQNGRSALSGFISWADIKNPRLDVFEEEESDIEEGQQVQDQGRSPSSFAHAHSKALSRILRQREIGNSCRRGWTVSNRSIPDELKEHIFDNTGPRRCFQGTSGDVTCIAWAADGNHFATGSIAITDERSMQYNKPFNLLLGDASRNLLYELSEHHVQRPVSTDVANVNSLHSMRQTQDNRLFMTVSGVQFSPDGATLYSAGTDCKVRAYAVHQNDLHPPCQQKHEHPAPVYLLSVSNQDILSTACHQATDDCIRIYRQHTMLTSLSPKRSDSQSNRPIFPSALKWGSSAHHTNLLLAGFSIDSFDEERNLAGETCLWDVHHEARVELSAVTRNVFDVAWNPSPSTGSTAFAVASTPGTNKVNRGMRSVVQCFAPRQNRAAAVLEFESRAFDINDVVYCPHDNNLIAAGATDGKIYIWDQRYAKQGNGPLHVLAHGSSLNVLDQDRDTEIADTGVRFLSWGATSSRLYSGSSDGIVKVWNPYRSSSDAHVKDVATFTSAIMSGAFNSEYRDLLIGEDQGSINLLSVGCNEGTVRAMERFELRPAYKYSCKDTSPAYDGRKIARELLDSGQIELRPMGALSMRQAVQGPNYLGPYLAPTSAQITDAENEYQLALNMQNEAHSRAAIDSTQSSEVDESLRDANRRVETAQDTVLRLQNKLDDAGSLNLRAQELQRGFRKAEKDCLKLEASLTHELQRCKLDCNYLPLNLDEDAGVPDSRRSEGRIPASLRSTPEIDTSDMNVNELIDAGFTQKCATCRGPASEPKSGLPLCASCCRKRSGVTAACEICSAHVRPSLDKDGSNLCERCNFSCFRCGRPAVVADNKAKISCYTCDLSWTPGVLGYDLVRQTTPQAE